MKIRVISNIDMNKIPEILVTEEWERGDIKNCFRNYLMTIWESNIEGAEIECDCIEFKITDKENGNDDIEVYAIYDDEVFEIEDGLLQSPAEVMGMFIEDMSKFRFTGLVDNNGLKN